MLDLNKNGILDPYVDPRRPIEAHVKDLSGQMTLEEQAGMMFINGAVVNEDSSIEGKPGSPGFGGVAAKQIASLNRNHFNRRQIPGAWVVAAWHNKLHRFAQQTRLGIPIMMVSDLRNHITRNIFSMTANECSQWCDPLGFAALGDADLDGVISNRFSGEPNGSMDNGKY